MEKPCWLVCTVIPVTKAVHSYTFIPPQQISVKNIVEDQTKTYLCLHATLQDWACSLHVSSIAVEKT